MQFDGGYENTITLPADKTVEKSLLSCLLQNNDACQWASINLSNTDFFFEAHKAIFQAIISSYNSTKSADKTLIQHWLKVNNKLDKLEISYIDELASDIQSEPDAQIVQYGAILKKLARLRTIHKVSTDTIASINSLNGNADEIYETAIINFRKAAESNQIVSGMSPICDITSDICNWIEDERLKPEGVYGLRSGISALDKPLRGFANQKLMLIKGQTKHGKTAFAGQIVFQSAIDLKPEDGEILIFCLEGSARSFMRRFVSWYSKVDNTKLKPGGDFNTSDFQRELLKKAYAKIPTLPIKISDTIKTIDAIEAEIRNAAMKGKVAGVLVDYAQLITGGRGPNQERQLADIAERLQFLSNEIDATIILPSQVTIHNDGRVTEKGASALRDNCTLCILIERGEKNQQTHEKLTSPLMKVICEASRDDQPFGVINTRFEGQNYRIYEMLQQEEQK